MRNRVEELLEELAEIERQMEDETLSHSDQQLLDQAWESLDNEINSLQEAIEMGEELDEEFERENEEFYADEADWGGEEAPISTTIQRVYHMGGNIYVSREELDRLNTMEYKEDRVACDYYETDFGVYYNAADEV